MRDKTLATQEEACARLHELRDDPSPFSARQTMKNKDIGLNTPIPSRNALENLSLIKKIKGPKTLHFTFTFHFFTHNVQD